MAIRIATNAGRASSALTCVNVMVRCASKGSPSAKRPRCCPCPAARSRHGGVCTRRGWSFETLFVQDLLDEGEPIRMRFEHRWLIVADTGAFSKAGIAGIERLACSRVQQSAIGLLLGAPSRDSYSGELSLLNRRSVEEVVGSLVFEHLRRFAR